MNAEQRKRIGDQIREAIRASELSQNEIGRRAGIDSGTLSKFMNDERGLSLESIEALAATLGFEIRKKTTKKK